MHSSSSQSLAVGGFGVELDRQICDQKLSLDLNSVIETPKKNSSGQLMQSKKSLDPVLNGSQSESGFCLEVEKVTENKAPGLKTVNSGPSNK